MSRAPALMGLLSLANYGDMARVQTVGAQHAVPVFQSHCILRASTSTSGSNVGAQFIAPELMSRNTSIS